MKIFAFFFLSLLSVQNDIKLYQNLEKDYSVEVRQSTQVKRVSLDIPNSYLDKFTIYNQDNSVDFGMNISKVMGVGKMNLELNNAYVEGIRNTCNCEIVESKEAKFKHFNGIQVMTKRTGSGEYNIIGYTIQLIKNNNLYNITFYTSEDKFSSYKSEFFKIIDSFNPVK